MEPSLTPWDLDQALQACADEPIHIPGNVQPFCVLAAYERGSGIVKYASQNAADVFGRPIDHILGHDMREAVGTRIWHELQNAAQLSDIALRRHFVTVEKMAIGERAISAFQSGDFMVVEIELDEPDVPYALQVMHEHTYLVDRLKDCDTADELWSKTVRLLRDATGFDRVMAYAFNTDGDGEVIAEARRSALEPMLNLRFPEWDIPAQARDIMMRLPLRVISDANNSGIPIQPHGPDLPDLDLSLAESRGVSPVHRQYLKNMQSAATMTLSIVLHDRLWGMISFHHQSPKISSLRTRSMLRALLPVLTLKLEQVTDREKLTFSRRVDDLQSEVQRTSGEDIILSDLLAKVAPPVFDTMNVQGMAVMTPEQICSEGVVPDHTVLKALDQKAREADTWEFSTESLTGALPEIDASDMGGAAGALVTVFENKGTIFLFRAERVRAIAWAGNPEKTIELGDGTPKLSPRGSFSEYLVQVADHCDPWSEGDRNLSRRLSPLVNAAERTALLDQVSEHENTMVEKLNHRVRNILSLVKSISKQAVADGGSVESYASAFEARVQALAAAHDMGTGAARPSVPIMAILNVERQPYNAPGAERIRVRGPDHFVLADHAPILALVIHELMTNAKKHGALSRDSGQIDVEWADVDGGVCLFWREFGGPKIRKPAKKGFGTNLILNAVPHELGGKSTLSFEEDGLMAQIFLPVDVTDMRPELAEDDARSSIALDVLEVPDAYKDGLVLIVEDSFMIASDLRADVEAAGFRNVCVCSNVADALESIEQEQVMFALLDVNLGQDETSEGIAVELAKRSVPFVLVTGYGDTFDFAGKMKNIVCLAKPVSKVELMSALARLPLQRPL